MSIESTPRERLMRLVTLVRRTRMFWRSSFALGAAGAVIALVVALRSQRAWRSETTLLYRDGIHTAGTETAPQRASRLGPTLKDLLFARPRLEQVIREFDLFPEKTERSMMDGIEEMKLAMGFRAKSSDSFVISFVYRDPVVTQEVTARITDLMLQEYNRQNLDSATLTRDFVQRQLEEATARVDEKSRALATFLAQHPQFQWGVNDSPYAPTPSITLGVPPFGARPPPLRPAPEAAAPVDSTLANLYRELARIEAQLGGDSAPPLPGPAAPVVIDAQKQRDAAAAALVVANAALAEKLVSVTDAHPDAVSAQGRVETAKQSLAAAEAALSAARAGVGIERVTEKGEPIDGAKRIELEQQRAQIRRRIGQARPRVTDAPKGSASAPGKSPPTGEKGPPDAVDLETDWHRLRLELEQARDQLRAVQTASRAADTSAAAAEKQGDAQMLILEPAYRPTRPDRGRGRVFFAGFAIAAFVALGYAGSRVLLNDTLLDEGDVAALGGPPVLVTLPQVYGAPPSLPEREMTPVRGTERPVQRVVAAGVGGAPVAIVVRGGMSIIEAAMDEPEVEVIGADLDRDGGGVYALLKTASPGTIAALRVLRHRLEQRRAGVPFVVSVVSPGAREGKTTLAALLSMTLSEAERARVILVEGNMARPQVAAMLGLRIPEEWSISAQIRRRLRGDRRPWGVVRLGLSLSAMAERSLEPDYPAALHSTHFEVAVAALRRTFDYVVIDGPEVLGSGDANVIEAVSDGVLIVVRAGQTHGAEVVKAVGQIGEGRVVGVVLGE